MKKDLEIKVILNDGNRPLVCFVYFTIFFGQEYGAWNYDSKINKVVSENQNINFEFMDNKYKAAIENAIEEKLYFFPFHLFNGPNVP